MRVAIRTDASSQIGTGHFVRCLTLADGLRQHGAHILFVSRYLPEYLRDVLAVKGHEFVLLESSKNDLPMDELAHSPWLGVSQVQDAADFTQVLSDQVLDWLIVDHYALDARWESALRQASKNIMVIDDIADRQHDCDMLLDQNFYVDMEARYVGKVPAHCQLLLGPRYVLLRDEFRQMRGHRRKGRVRRILVFFGGIDSDNYTGRAIEVLSEIGMPDLQVDVVVGAQHPYVDQIYEACTRYGYVCHVQTDKMAELMKSADLAIGAGGTAIWERCCLGLPALVFCTADNQRKQIADAALNGLLYAPSFESDWVIVIKNHIIALLENDHLRQLITRNAMQFVDGLGVLRVIGNMGCSGIVMREASWDDSLKLFEWRNHLCIRSASRNTGSITWEEHQKWFSTVMSSEDRIMLIGQNDEVPVGVVRFDKHENEAEVSIYLVPDENHSGQGRNLLLSAEQWLRKKNLEIKQIRAIVLGGNKPSHQLFIGAGYQVESSHYLKQL